MTNSKYYLAFLSIIILVYSGCKSHPTAPQNIAGNLNDNFIDIPITSSDGDAIGLSPDGSLLATWSGVSGHWYVRETKAGSILCTSSDVWGAPPIMRFSNDNTKLLLTGEYGPSLLYDITTPLSKIINDNERDWTGKLSDSGTIINLIDATKGLTDVNVYGGNSGSFIKTIHPANRHNRIYSYTWGVIQDENSIIYPDNSGGMTVWSVDRDSQMRNYRLGSYLNYDVQISEDGLTFTSYLFDSITTKYRYSKFYNTKTGQKINEFPNDTFAYSNQLFLSQNYFFRPTTVGGILGIRITKIVDGTSNLKQIPEAKWINPIVISRNEEYLAALYSYDTTIHRKIRIWKLK